MPTYSEAKREALQELIVQYKGGYLSVPALMGAVGIGKTEMAADLAVEAGEVIGDELLFEAIATGEASDPTDTAGIPWVIPVTGDPTSKELKTLWVLNRAAYQACQVPTLMLYDDIDKATPMVVNSLLNVFVHRRFKDFKLHPKSLMMCAGNRSVDDRNANELSESMKTRISIIEVEATLADFVEWGKRVDSDNDQLINPYILGFLTSRPELLHQKQEGVYRFPTPRGYREASLHMKYFPTINSWHRLMDRKVGTAAANDFWNWYTILSKIDVDHILDVGTLKSQPQGDAKTPAAVAKKMAEFAAVFAVTNRLNQRISPNHQGLERFCSDLSPELRVAFLLQLRESTKKEFTKSYGRAAGEIMGTIIKGGA